jgi:hypothetical protein
MSKVFDVSLARHCLQAACVLPLGLSSLVMPDTLRYPLQLATQVLRVVSVIAHHTAAAGSGASHLQYWLQLATQVLLVVSIISHHIAAAGSGASHLQPLLSFLHHELHACIAEGFHVLFLTCLGTALSHAACKLRWGLSRMAMCYIRHLTSGAVCNADAAHCTCFRDLVVFLLQAVAPRICSHYCPSFTTSLSAAAGQPGMEQ